MPRVINTTEFKRFLGKYAKELLSDKVEHPDYFIVANANKAENSFVVVKKEYFMALLQFSGLTEELDRVKESLQDVANYVKAKQSRAAKKSWENR